MFLTGLSMNVIYQVDVRSETSVEDFIDAYIAGLKTNSPHPMPTFDPDNAVHPTTRRAWRRWLQENHQRGRGVWLISYRNRTGRPRVEYEDAVEEALCFGWIDSMVKTIDEERGAQWYAPRRPRTGWSRSNKQRVERLIEAKLMKPAGLAAIEAASQDGSWEMYDLAEALEVPDDLARALKRHRGARETFDGFPKSVRRGTIAWICSAKREETRRRRVDDTAERAARGVRPKPWDGGSS